MEELTSEIIFLSILGWIVYSIVKSFQWLKSPDERFILYANYTDASLSAIWPLTILFSFLFLGAHAEKTGLIIIVFGTIALFLFTSLVQIPLLLNKKDWLKGVVALTVRGLFSIVIIFLFSVIIGGKENKSSPLERLSTIFGLLLSAQIMKNSVEDERFVSPVKYLEDLEFPYIGILFQSAGIFLLSRYIAEPYLILCISLNCVPYFSKSTQRRLLLLRGLVK